MTTRPATLETALLMPDAMPEFVSLTEVITVVVKGATNRVTPMLKSVTPGSTEPK